MAAAGLHICERCGSGLVQPTRWEQAGRSWRLWRRCPECEWRRSCIHTEREIDQYDGALDEGTAMLTAQLRQLERENMLHVANTFAAALEADLLGADDFR